tara:strand:+ start:4076 stop:5323 length:1248 start_codon:yes stop_codon:yes gene_type:complete
MEVKLSKFYILLLLVFSWMPRLNIISETDFSYFLLLPCFYFFLSIFKNGFVLRFKDFKWIVFFLLIVTLSSLINAVNFKTMILNIRWLLMPLFFYFFLLNSKLKLNEIKKIIKFIYIIAILHIPIAFFKFYVLEWDGEWPLGLIGYSYSTLFVLIFLSGVLSHYLTFRKLKYLILVLGVLIIAFSSGKRALVLLMPLTILFYFLISGYFKSKFFRSVLIITILVPSILVILIKINPTLNKERKVWGSFDVNYALNYIQEYTSKNRLGEDYRLANRSTTTFYILNYLFENPKNFVFGLGGDKFSKTEMKKDKSSKEVNVIEYGINGFGWLSFQFGFIAAFMWFMFFLKFYRNGKNLYERSNDIFWRTYGLTIMGSSIALSIVQFSYAPDFKNPVFISAVYLFLFPAKILNARYYEK